MTLGDAKEQGIDVYRKLVSCPQGNFRLVVWTWPSDRIHGMARDARAKAARADGEAYYLASFLSKIPCHCPVSLMGYSFGARCVAGSVHLLGGGTWAGHQIEVDRANIIRPRVVLLAAALPIDWLAPRGSMGRVMSQASQVVSFYNARDPALKMFETFGARDDLLGRKHVSEQSLGVEGNRLLQYNATVNIGKSHNIDDYFDTPSLMQAIRLHLLQTGKI